MSIQRIGIFIEISELPHIPLNTLQDYQPYIYIRLMKKFEDPSPFDEEVIDLLPQFDVLRTDCAEFLGLHIQLVLQGLQGPLALQHPLLVVVVGYLFCLQLYHLFHIQEATFIKVL